MNSVLESVRQVEQVAESIKSDATQRFPEAASLNDAVRQGDLYITLIANVPLAAKLVKKPSKQLAPGNTQGSRHCISNMRNVRVFANPQPSAYDGPILEVKKEVTIEHPEHGDWVLNPGCYAISYQRTEDSEGRIRRVQD